MNDAASHRIAPGTRIGPYIIEQPIGSGGMGQVFHATDTRLNRPVAIKVCEGRFSERFGREAKMIAALNHPSICTLYDVGPDYLVMERIDGITLSQKLKNGSLPVADAVQYAIQIADALAEAHGRGIVHRDLKPGNIMLTRHGVKVLDFGLAKSIGDATGALTETGVVLGTPAYMAPEQVLGRDSYATDLFSLGLILYEMISGHQPMPGASLGVLLTHGPVEFPPPSKRRSGVSSDLDALICRLLNARPDDRQKSAADVRDQLKQSLRPTEVRGAGLRWLIAFAIFAVIVAGGAGWWRLHSSSVPTNLELSGLRPLGTITGDKYDPSYSPDGMIAFSWRGENNDQPGIYIFPAGSTTPVQLTRSSTSDVSPVWSPAGKRIAFLRLHPQTEVHELRLIELPEKLPETFPNDLSRKLRDVSQPELLSRTLRPLLTWAPDGQSIVVPTNDPEVARASLFRVRLDGTPAQRLMASSAGIGDTAPSYSPDKKTLAFTNLDGSSSGQLFVVNAAADGSVQGTPRPVPEAYGPIISPLWSPDSRALIFSIRQQLFSWEEGNMPRQIHIADGYFQAMTAHWLPDGLPEILATNVGHTSELRTLLLDTSLHKAELSPAPFVKLGGFNGNPALSPDGRWLTFVSSAGGDAAIWIAKSNGESPRQLVNQSAGGGQSWSPDSKRIAFHGRLPGNPVAQIFILDIDSDGNVTKTRQVTHSSFGLLGTAWSPDGKYIYTSGTRGSQPRVIRVTAETGEVEDLFEGANSRLSVDGNHFYYSKPNQPGIFERTMNGNVIDTSEQPVFADWKGPAGFSPSKLGIFYVGLNSEGNPSAIRFYDYALHRSFDLAPPPRVDVPILTTSPDGKRLVYEARSLREGELMLLQFRRK